VGALPAAALDLEGHGDRRRAAFGHAAMLHGWHGHNGVSLGNPGWASSAPA
jgi:hypothetical protein